MEVGNWCGVIFTLMVAVFFYSVNKWRPAMARSCINVYFTSGLILLTCFALGVRVSLKEGYWTAFPLWWNGLPQGHMSFIGNLYSRILLAMLCFDLILLGFSGHCLTKMLDRSIDGVLNLALSITCYAMNFIPLLMVVIPYRFGIQILLLFVHMIALLDTLREGRDFARVVLRTVRMLTCGEVIFYENLILANIIYGHRDIYEQMFVHVPLAAMLVVSGYRVLQPNKYDFNLLRAGDYAQGSGSVQQALDVAEMAVNDAEQAKNVVEKSLNVAKQALNVALERLLKENQSQATE